MRNSSNRLHESILDNITADDNVKQTSSQIIAKDIPDKVTLEDGQERWRWRLKVTKHMSNYVRTEKEVEDELRELFDKIFASCYYVTEYEICKVDEHYLNWTSKSHIDVLFNTKKTSFSRMMRTLFIPIMRVLYENQNYRFSFIDLLDLQKPMDFYSGMWFKYMYSAVTGDKAFDRDKGGVYYEWLKLYNIATHKMHYDSNNDEVFAAFFDLLLYTVYKTKWTKKFRSMKRDEDGYAIFDVDVQIADCDTEGHIKGTVRLLARDSFTMATKMMILRSMVSDFHWIAISEKHQNVIPLCYQSMQKQHLHTTTQRWKVLNLLDGEEKNSPYCYTSVAEMMKALENSASTREERLFALQKFGCDKEFNFTF